MKSRLHPLLLVFLLVAAANRLDAQVRHEYTEVHMGMPVRIVLHAPDDATARAAARAAFARVAELDAILSDYRASSELRRLGPLAGSWVLISVPLFEVLQRALDVARLTDGAFDPTIGPLAVLWRDARKAGAPPAPAAIDSARRFVDWRMIRLDSARRAVRLDRLGMRLDLGGIAKGYILDAALEALRDHRVVAALVEAGGDIVVGAAPPGMTGWNIDVPGATTDFAARAAALTHAALATSGPTFQFLAVDGKRYSHVIDPRTGFGLTEAHVVRIIAPNATLADALATALGVLGPAGVDRLARRYPGVVSDVTTVLRDGDRILYTISRQSFGRRVTAGDGGY